MSRPNTGKTIIYLSKVRAPQGENDRRAWDILVTHNGMRIHPNEDMPFEDPWLRREYPACFKFLVDDSLYPDSYDRTEEEDNNRLQRAMRRIREYGTTLLGNLGLDRTTLARLGNHDIFIIEDLEHAMNDNGE